MQNKKILITILCGVLALVLLFTGVCAAMLITGGSGSGTNDENVYQKQLDLGNKYLEEENYEQAIAAFKAAIEEDPDGEEAYSLLAGIYRNLGYNDELQFLLADGISRTNSERLRSLYEEYFGIKFEDVKYKYENSSDIYIDSSVTQAVANYTYDNYRHHYTGVRVDVNNDIYIVSMQGFDGRLYFYDEGDYKSLDRDAKEPIGTVRPNHVVLDDLSFLFAGLDSGEEIEYHELQGMGAMDIEKKHDTSFGDYVRFIYNHCVVEIAIDGDGKFDAQATNKLYSEFGTGAENGEENAEHDHEENEETTAPPVETFEVTVKVISATTAEGVGNATVQVLEVATGIILYNGSTTSDGNFTFNASAGIYALQVICDGYVIESFEIEVYTTGEYSVDTIVISPELAVGEMRIVLEWGDHPRDLDSYYLDATGNVGVAYYSRQYYNGDQLVAELDVDDTDGYGPETITVYDPSQTFTYCVHDYTQTGDMFSRGDITVKVYIAGSSEPMVFTPTIDETNESTVWTVFTCENGEIQFINQSSADVE